MCSQATVLEAIFNFFPLLLAGIYRVTKMYALGDAVICAKMRMRLFFLDSYGEPEERQSFQE